MTSPRTKATHRCVAALLAACVGLGVSLPASAQWKWRDRNGLVQYSDLPPPQGIPDKDILQRPSAATARVAPLPTSAPSAAPLLNVRASEPELEAKRRQAEQEAADKKKADDAKNAAIRAQNCAAAQEQKRTLDSGVRIVRTEPNGERDYLDDSQRAAESTKAQQAIASNCGG